jgi:chromosome partitioning protein
MEERKEDGFTIGYLKKIFHIDITPSALQQAEKSGRIPIANRQSRGRVAARMWTIADVPFIGKEYGRFQRPPHCAVISSYVPKGGVGKTTWSFNFVRLLALHGIKTLAIGADFQCSMSKSFGARYDDENEMPASLYDVMLERCSIEDVITNSDIPTLDYIPESPELALLDRHIFTKNRRETLLQKLLEPLKSKYDVILIDCPPQWNELVTNALIASDAIICPILADGESNHSFKMFARELKTFIENMDKHFRLIKFIPNGVDLRNKYTTGYQKRFLNDYPDIFTTTFLRDSVFVKESTEVKKSVCEYDPKSSASDDFYNAALEVWTDLLEALADGGQ